MIRFLPPNPNRNPYQDIWPVVHIKFDPWPFVEIWEVYATKATALIGVDRRISAYTNPSISQPHWNGLALLSNGHLAVTHTGYDPEQPLTWDGWTWDQLTSRTPALFVAQNTSHPGETPYPTAFVLAHNRNDQPGFLTEDTRARIIPEWCIGSDVDGTWRNSPRDECLLSEFRAWNGLAWMSDNTWAACGSNWNERHNLPI